MTPEPAPRPPRRRHHRRRPRRPDPRRRPRRRRSRHRRHLGDLAGEPRPGRGDPARACRSSTSPRWSSAANSSSSRCRMPSWRSLVAGLAATRRLAAGPARAAHLRPVRHRRARARPARPARSRSPIHPAMTFTGTSLDLAELADSYFAVTAPEPGAADRPGARRRDGRRAGDRRRGRPRGLRGGHRDRDGVLDLDRRPGHRGCWRASASRRPAPCSRRSCARPWRTRSPAQRAGSPRPAARCDELGGTFDDGRPSRSTSTRRPTLPDDDPEDQ